MPELSCLCLTHHLYDSKFNKLYFKAFSQGKISKVACILRLRAF